ncbi:Ppx/GppA family phosphatase [Noviherbaspirillum cavernae]|uniref:Ppx/GppA family phosphatase n=1 Tax=Noviherbaspirillum cavernae TaxID=2320862 RepID=A0A418X608_9BURK|nr:Ppx/GppA phosphatase family protein [Noviherbaspirillum cavernae]RJG07922.1 Ppx/GppA family phosphatase [Noviherbaspirillum cavernae]
MFAAVDLGSNSFRMHIGTHDGSAIQVLKSMRDPIRLGAGLDSDGNLTEQAMKTALESLARFQEVLSAYQLDAVRVVATNTLRIAKNSAAFLPAAEKAIGYPIEVLSGEEEGRLIYLGVASTLPASHEGRLVIDIGGGSTELILGRGRAIEQVESFSIGTVPQTRSFFPDGRIDAAAFEAAILSARSYFEDGGPPFYASHWSRAYGSSGTIRAISEVIAKNAIGDGKLSYANLETLTQRLIACGHVDKVSLAGIKPERVPVLTGGLALLMGLMQELGIKSMTAVEAGLRMGVLWDLHLRATQHDRRELSVRDFMQRFHVDMNRANQVAHTAGVLFTQLKPTTDAYGKYVYWSGLLHEIGLAVSHTGYHKHGAYVVQNADLPGFTGRDQRLVSTLILAQKGNLRKVDEALSDSDFAKSVLALRLAVMFMHSRIPVDLSELQLKMKNKIEIDIRQDWISDHPTVSYWIGKERGFWDEVGVNFAVRTGE